MTTITDTNIQPAPERVEQFIGTVVGDLGATVSSALTHIGRRLGLYRAMAGAGPITAADLADRTGTDQRLLAEWLANQAAGGYVEYAPDDGTYELPLEHAMVLAEEDSPVYMGAGFDQMTAVWATESQLEDALRSDGRLPWSEHDDRVFGATEAMFKPAYRAHLVDDWIPALDGVRERLVQGGCVADVGCGHGATAILLAEAFPTAEVRGFDHHAPSVDAAQRRAGEAGVDDRDRLTFAVAEADTFPIPDGGYDLICMFDAFHEFGDPLAAARHALEALAPGGAIMVVEIRSEDRQVDNLNPFGRLAYGMSTFICTPNALSQAGGHALGGQAGVARLADIFRDAGFTSVRRAAEAEIHHVLEVRS